MDKDKAVLIVDESPHEAAVITSAIRLHEARLEVRTVPSAQAAYDYLHDAGSGAARRLVILGARAIADAPELLSRLNGARTRHAIVGIAPQIPAAVRQRALDAGVCNVHERPSSWPQYRDLVKEILARWLSAARE